MNERIPSATVPYVSPARTDGINHWVVVSEDPNSRYGEFVNVYSHDIDELIEALRQAREAMATAGAEMEVPAAGLGGQP